MPTRRVIPGGMLRKKYAWDAGESKEPDLGFRRAGEYSCRSVAIQTAESLVRRPVRAFPLCWQLFPNGVIEWRT